MHSIDTIHLYLCQDGVSCRLWRSPIQIWIQLLPDRSNNKFRGHKNQTTSEIAKLYMKGWVFKRCLCFCCPDLFVFALVLFFVYLVLVCLGVFLLFSCFFFVFFFIWNFHSLIYAPLKQIIWLLYKSIVAITDRESLNLDS